MPANDSFAEGLYESIVSDRLLSSLQSRQDLEQRIAGDGDADEYVIPVDWERSVPKEQAIREKGLFANQNSACKLRQQFTIERLMDRFGLTE